MSPLYEEPAQQQMNRGRLREHIKRMVQSGRPSGWIKADGETFRLDRASWVAERDRSWGIRVAGADFVESGVQLPEIYDGQLFNFVLMQFKDWGASFHIREIWDDKAGLARRWHFGGGVFYPFGSTKEPIELQHVEHYYEFDDRRPEQQRRFAGGRVVMTAIEHHAVIDTANDLETATAARVTVVPVDRDGLVDPAVLEEALGRPIELFAYPSGEDGGGSAVLERAGYRAAFLYEGGPQLLPAADRFRLARIPIGSDTDLEAELARAV